MKNSVSGILEGLYLKSNSNSVSISEGTSVFSSKLNDFIKDLDQVNQKFIKKALNSIYLGFQKDYGGYTEGKRPVIKSKGNYKVMTIKVQTNKSTNYQFYNIVRKYFDEIGFKPFDASIDGNNYYCICSTINDVDDKFDNSFRKFKDEFDIENVVVVGIDHVERGEKLDKNGEGDAFRLIVSIPNNIKSEGNTNSFVSKQGSEYTFNNGKDFWLSYDADRMKFRMSIDQSSGYTLVVLYKPMRKAEKAFYELMQVFNKDTTRAEVEDIIENKYGIHISTSYYPGMD